MTQSPTKNEKNFFLQQHDRNSRQNTDIDQLGQVNKVQIYNIDSNRHVFITVQTYIIKHVAFLSADYRECNQLTIQPESKLINGVAGKTTGHVILI